LNYVESHWTFSQSISAGRLTNIT